MTPSDKPDEFYLLFITPTTTSVGKLKHPFDEEYFNILRASATACVKHYSSAGGRVFIHQYGVVISLARSTPLEDAEWDYTEIVSFFTAHVNSRYSKLMFFNLADDEWIENGEDATLWLVDNAQNAIDLAKTAYEMFVEESKFKTDTSLFPGVGYVTFENTPEFFREGLILDI